VSTHDEDEQGQGPAVFGVVDGRRVTLAGLTAGSGVAVGITRTGKAARADGSEFTSFRWGLAPAGVATRRQLAGWGLRPGGAEPVGRLVWRGGRRFADLYPIERARAKRAMTPAKWAALAAAMTARRTCRTCGRDAGYVIPTSLGRCLDCHDGATDAVGVAA
jgi:hypothetical protein